MTRGSGVFRLWLPGMAALLLILAGWLIWGALFRAWWTVEKLWPETVSIYLESPLWRSEYNYDAAHFLMLPLHCAYETCPGNQTVRQREFDEFFSRFLPSFTSPLDSNPLRESQFLYLVSQYLLLSEKEGRWGESQERLRLQLSASLESLWLERPAPHWAYSSNFPNVRARLLWKLNPTRTGQRYFAAVIDEEYFLMAIAADLHALSALQGHPAGELQSDVLDVAWRVFQQQGVFTEEGNWLMQPGVWADHKDYRYAGHTGLAPGLEPAVVDGIAMDVSHSHRMVLWLQSLAAGALSDERRAYYRQTLSGFVRQWEKHVYLAPGTAFPWPALVNYLDGHNGVYRYGYETTGDALGYGPHQLSYALIAGWYGLLPSPMAAEGYQWLARRFPLSEEEIAFYLGPDTLRERHEIVKGKNFYTQGFAELLINISVLGSVTARP